jgi:CheY-like chemotaxis protein
MKGDILMSNRHTVKPIDILLVEDNPSDVDLAREALDNSKFNNDLHVVDDGEKAMAFLRRAGVYVHVPRPDLILLDLNLPKKDGRQVLAEIKSDDNLKRIPVVILTTSRAEEDVLKSYDLHANCYITKPIDLNQFLHVVRSIEDFWLSIVVLPSSGAKK